MKCPKCRNEPLKVTKLEDDLPVQGCDACGGAIISLLHYRDWAERTLNDEADTDNSNLEVNEDSDTKTALACPKCAKLMTKFKISGRTGNRLDLCTSCDEAWVDDGEWELLKALKISKIIPNVFTDSWQRRVRHEMSEKRSKERFHKLFGEADMNKVDEIKLWLEGHPKKTEILFYLGKK